MGFPGSVSILMLPGCNRVYFLGACRVEGSGAKSFQTALRASMIPGTIATAILRSFGIVSPSMPLDVSIGPDSSGKQATLLLLLPSGDYLVSGP